MSGQGTYYAHDPLPDTSWHWGEFLRNGLAMPVFEEMVGANRAFVGWVVRGHTWTDAKGCWRVGCPALSLYGHGGTDYVGTFDTTYLAFILRRDVSAAAADALQRAVVRLALEDL